MPSISASRTKPQVSGNISLKNILGSNTTVAPAWKQSNSSMGDGGGGGGGGGGGLANTAVVEEQGEVGEGPSVSGDATVATTAPATTHPKGRKERGKQKQTLFTIGSLAT